MKNKGLYIAIIILAFLGIINAAYLSYEAYTILNPSTASLLGGSFCDINETFSCTSFMNMAESRVFGIPFPYIALCVYPVLFVLSLLAYCGKKFWAVKAITILAIMGICFNSVIISREFVVGVFCPLCMMCTGYIITIAILGGIIWKNNCQKCEKNNK